MTASIILAAAAQAQAVLAEHAATCAGRECLIARALVAASRVEEQRDAAEAHLADRKSEIVDALELPPGMHRWCDLIDVIRLLRTGPARMDDGTPIRSVGAAAKDGTP